MPEFIIIPAGVLDSSHATDSIIAVGWVLDQRIDSQRVHESWNVLISAWPILVSRLRKNSQTRNWEYHIPVVASAEGSFATLDVRDSIHNHYNFAKPANSIRSTPKENPHHLFFPTAPTTVDELLTRDVPLTHLHVTNFNDASLVGLYTPHILCDGHGVATIARALSSILGGDPPPPPLHYDDPFLPFLPTPNDSTASAPPCWRTLNFVERMVLYARSLWDFLFCDHIENRDVFFPREEVARIKELAMDDIRHEHEHSGKDLWVSSSDALLAFCLKCKHLSTTSRAPLNVFYTANLRKLLSIPTPFLHNSVCMVVTPTLPVCAISNMSLGALALHIRRTLESQTTPSAIETWVRWRLKNANKTKVFFDPWFGQWDIVTNWREMKLMNVDFSGAVHRSALSETGPKDDGGVKDGRVKCLYMWGNGIQPVSLRNWIGLWADDPSGGVWMSGFLPRRVWEDRRGFGAFIAP
ncbi:hypothetical protein C8Q80DRAFT_1337354 [Daedaleopsis nitida]|nr:hypothetical protein C8Q80DRAFT_1337354 [Daedaleopsis nitida]